MTRYLKTYIDLECDRTFTLEIPDKAVYYMAVYHSSENKILLMILFKINAFIKLYNLIKVIHLLRCI